MNTGNVNFVRHTYQVSKELKSYTVYQLDEVKNNTNLLTGLIRIEPFLNKSKANNFNDYFRIYNKTSWAKSDLITGLIPTTTKGLFFGDCRKTGIIGNTKKSLLLFYYVPNSNKLIIDVFTDYYPFNDFLLINHINEFKTN